MRTSRNLISIRSACLLYHTELRIQTDSEAHPATVHPVKRGFHQTFFRPVSEAVRSRRSNNVTNNFVLVHICSLAGGADVKLQLFTAPSIHKSVSKFTARKFTNVDKTIGTKWTGGRMSPKNDMYVLDKRHNFYTLENRTLYFLLP